MSFWVREHCSVCLIPPPAMCSLDAQLSPTLRPHGLYPTRLLWPWDSPGKNAGIGCHALLQGIFLTQGSDLCLLSPALAGKFFTTSTKIHMDDGAPVASCFLGPKSQRQHFDGTPFEQRSVNCWEVTENRLFGVLLCICSCSQGKKTW